MTYTNFIKLVIIKFIILVVYLRVIYINITSINLHSVYHYSIYFRKCQIYELRFVTYPIFNFSKKDDLNLYEKIDSRIALFHLEFSCYSSTKRCSKNHVSLFHFQKIIKFINIYVLVSLHLPKVLQHNSTNAYVTLSSLTAANSKNQNMFFSFLKKCLFPWNFYREKSRTFGRPLNRYVRICIIKQIVLEHLVKNSFLYVNRYCLLNSIQYQYLLQILRTFFILTNKLSVPLTEKFSFLYFIKIFWNFYF